ncbi:MAG: hypothetical protein GQ470_03840 [Gammaproteobacteria bacterium]|nr:hypothetical protein [Gammaproteobacteria bacterium]
MATVKKKGATASTWRKSDKSIRAIQVIFELEQAQSKALRMRALEMDLSPSDYIRELVGLPRKKPVRPRLSISLSEADCTILAKRYNLDKDDKVRIREEIKAELIKSDKT